MAALDYQKDGWHAIFLKNSHYHAGRTARLEIGTNQGDVLHKNCIFGDKMKRIWVRNFIFLILAFFALSGCNQAKNELIFDNADSVIESVLNAPDTYERRDATLLWRGSTENGQDAFIVQVRYSAKNLMGVPLRGCDIVAFYLDGDKVKWNGNFGINDCEGGENGAIMQSLSPKEIITLTTNLNGFRNDSGTQDDVSSASASQRQSAAQTGAGNEDGSRNNKVNDLVVRAFSPDMLGTTPSAFEKIAGAAQRIDGDTQTYDVEGCKIYAEIKNGAINMLTLDFNDSCSVDLAKLGLIDRPTVVSSLTFGDFDKLTNGNIQAIQSGDANDLIDKSQNNFYSDCIRDCGNAADPTVFEVWEGPHSMNFLNVKLEVTLVGDAIDASEKWSDAMAKGSGDDFVTEAKFNCNPDLYRAVAHRNFSNIKATAITIGYDIPAPTCG